jgi:hypothetical protein
VIGIYLCNSCHTLSGCNGISICRYSNLEEKYKKKSIIPFFFTMKYHISDMLFRGLGRGCPPAISKKGILEQFCLPDSGI